MKIWDKYSEESEKLAKRLGKIVRKREVHVMTTNDEEMANTLADELRACVEDVIKSQDEILSPISEDPRLLLEILLKAFGADKPKTPVVDPEEIKGLGPRIMYPKDLT